MTAETSPPAASDHDPDELVQIDEIARRLDVPQGTIYAWRHRGVFPRHDAVRGPNGGVFLWRWSTITGAQLPPRRARVVGRPQA